MRLNSYHCIFLISFLIPATNTLAQRDSLHSHKQIYFRHELSISRGRYSTDELFDGNDVKGAPSNDYGEGKYSGTFALTYRYYINPHIAIGAAVAYENDAGWWSYNSDLKQGAAGTYKRQVFTVAPELTFIYYAGFNGTMSLYGCVGLGASYQNEVVAYEQQAYNSKYYNGVNPLGEKLQKDQSRTHMNILLCPIGIKLGRKVCLFSELGLGYKGFLAFGAMMQFGKYTLENK